MNLTPKQIHYCVKHKSWNRHEDIEQKTKQEIEAIRLQSLNELYEMDFFDVEKKDIATFKKIIESISIEKADEWISDYCSGASEDPTLARNEVIHKKDGAVLNVPNAITREAKGGLPPFAIFQKTTEGSLSCSNKKLSLSGTEDESLAAEHVAPILKLVDNISEHSNMSSENKKMS